MICRPTEGWWSATALLAARERFHPRVVEIFYDALEVEHVNAGEARDHLLPSPTDGDYRRVLLRGATGAGETTLLGQLIGTDPDDERFPLRPRAAPRSRLPRSSPPKDRTRRRSPSSRWTRSASTWSTVHRARSWPRTAATGVPTAPRRPPLAGRLVTDPAWPTLCRALARAEQRPHGVDRVLGALADGPEVAVARSPARLVSARLDDHLTGNEPTAHHSHRPPPWIPTPPRDRLPPEWRS